jgi:WD repeat-containing protein 34
MFDSTLSEYILISTSVDGKVLVWSLRNNLTYPIRGYVTSKGKTTSTKWSMGSCPGVCCLSIPDQVHGHLSRTHWGILGLEGGGLIRVQASRLVGSSMFTKDTFKSQTNPDDIYQPIKSDLDKFSHEKHIGNVHMLEVSPFNRNIFLSVGQDGCAKLFHMSETSPIRTWEPVPPTDMTASTEAVSALTSVGFSPVRPLVFAVTSVDGLLYLFDLGASIAAPVATLEVPDSIDGFGLVEGRVRVQKRRTVKRPGLMGVAFNCKQRDLVAACDTAGCVHIWRLSWSFCNKQVSEEALFDSLVGISTHDTSSIKPSS